MWKGRQEPAREGPHATRRHCVEAGHPGWQRCVCLSPLRPPREQSPRHVVQQRQRQPQRQPAGSRGPPHLTLDRGVIHKEEVDAVVAIDYIYLRRAAGKREGRGAGTPAAKASDSAARGAGGAGCATAAAPQRLARHCSVEGAAGHRVPGQPRGGTAQYLAEKQVDPGHRLDRVVASVAEVVAKHRVPGSGTAGSRGQRTVSGGVCVAGQGKDAAAGVEAKMRQLGSGADQR